MGRPRYWPTESCVGVQSPRAWLALERWIPMTPMELHGLAPVPTPEVVAERIRAKESK